MDGRRCQPKGRPAAAELDGASACVHSLSVRSMSAENPRSAADLPPDISPCALIDLYQRHLLALTAARVNRTQHAPEEIVDHALAALSIATALINDLREEMAPIVHDALRLGADPTAVAAAVWT